MWISYFSRFSYLRPTERVTGAPSFMHGPLCLHLLLEAMHLCACMFWSVVVDFGTNLEPSWSLLGQVGPCWGHVGTRLGQVGAKLGQLGPSWFQVGAKLRQVGTMLGQVGRSWGQVGAMLADLSRKLALTTQGYPTCRRKSSKIDPKSPT